MRVSTGWSGQHNSAQTQLLTPAIWPKPLYSYVGSRTQRLGTCNGHMQHHQQWTRPLPTATASSSVSHHEHAASGIAVSAEQPARIVGHLTSAATRTWSSSVRRRFVWTRRVWTAPQHKRATLQRGPQKKRNKLWTAPQEKGLSCRPWHRKSTDCSAVKLGDVVGCAMERK